MEWFVYLLRCNDASLYCGITTDLQRRLNEHNHTDLGAAYTRSRRPVELAWYEKADTRGDALRREAQIKRLPKREKERLAVAFTLDNAADPEPLTADTVHIEVVALDTCTYDDPHIRNLWDTLQMVYMFQDPPQLWKLTKDYASAVGQFLNLPMETVALSRLWSIEVDLTSGLPGLIAETRHFPVIRQQT